MAADPDRLPCFLPARRHSADEFSPGVLAMTAPDQIVDAFYESYNAHDTSAVAALYPESGWHEEVNSGRRREGRTAVAEGIAGFFKMMPDVIWTERERIFAKNAVAVVYTMRGHLETDVGPIKATGQEVVLSGLHVLEFDEAGLKGTRDFWNMADIVRQIS
jgi:steroid delta-isomerase-like uncharacterized protein